MADHKSTTKKEAEAARKAASEESRRLAWKRSWPPEYSPKPPPCHFFSAGYCCGRRSHTPVFFLHIQVAILIACAAAVVLLIKYARSTPQRLASRRRRPWPRISLCADFLCLRPIRQVLSARISETFSQLFVYLLIVALPVEKKKAARSAAVLLSGTAPPSLPL
jgi:hypothetical protein